MVDSSTFKRFTANMGSILDTLEDVDLAAAGKQRVLHSFNPLDIWHIDKMPLF